MPIRAPVGFDPTFSGTPFCPNEPRSLYAWESSGLHPEYIKPIADVANMFNTIVLIRAMDPNYVSLLDAGYTTKSMHIHSKTCNWGPMAGFVCFDPRFHKGAVTDPDARRFQLTALAESLSYVRHPLTQLCPLHITEARLADLIERQMLTVLSAQSDSLIVHPHPIRGNYVFKLLRVRHGAEPLYRVCLINENRLLPGVPLLAAVEYAPLSAPAAILNECRDKVVVSTYAESLGIFDVNVRRLLANLAKLNTQFPKLPDSLQDILVLVDPHTKYVSGDYRGATTGDYDLFAFHPLLARYAAHISHTTAEPSMMLPTWITDPASSKIYKDPALDERIRIEMQRTHLLPIDRRHAHMELDVCDLDEVRSAHSALSRDVSPAPSPIQSPTTPKGMIEAAKRLARSGSEPSLTSADSSPVAVSPLPMFAREGSDERTAFPSMPRGFTPALYGRLTQRDLEIIVALNIRINYKGGRLFHHGPDARNPHGEVPDLPCVAIIPCVAHSSHAHGAGCVRMIFIENIEQLEDFYFWSVICSGYALTPGINSRWFEDAAAAVPVVQEGPLGTIVNQHFTPQKRPILKQFLDFEQKIIASRFGDADAIHRIWHASLQRAASVRST